MDKAIKRRKGVESQTIAVGVEARADACRKYPTENGVICTQGRNYIDLHYYPPKWKWNFRRTLITA